MKLPTPEIARDFRTQLQQARETALKDAEAFDGIIHVVERLGSFCSRRVGTLGSYRDDLTALADTSPLAVVPATSRNVHTPFNSLYDMVANARNDALHIGAFARHLTTHAIELAVILEDALRIHEDAKYVSDYMIRSPVCAHLWEPVSFVRQRMLANSFSFLPVKNRSGQWCLVSDLQVAKYLHDNNGEKRRERLATPLEEATEIEPLQATRISDTTPIGQALTNFDGKPLLVCRGDSETELVGIVTSFDLL
jgi:CBS domain-containing protein